MFTPIPVEITANDPEVTGLDLLHKTKFAKMRQVEPIPDLARISEGTGKLEHMLDAVISYVEDVLSGREKPNNAVGRKLLDLVYSVPKMTPDEFEKMINSNMKVSILCSILNHVRCLSLTFLPKNPQHNYLCAVKWNLVQLGTGIMLCFSQVKALGQGVIWA